MTCKVGLAYCFDVFLKQLSPGRSPTKISAFDRFRHTRRREILLLNLSNIQAPKPSDTKTLYALRTKHDYYIFLESLQVTHLALWGLNGNFGRYIKCSGWSLMTAWIFIPKKWIVRKITQTTQLLYTLEPLCCTLAQILAMRRSSIQLKEAYLAATARRANSDTVFRGVTPHHAGWPGRLQVSHDIHSLPVERNPPP